MWAEDVKICDPSKLTVPCCKEILQLWRGRQQIGGASHTFRFSFFLDDKELSPALYDLSPKASTAAPNTRNPGSAAPFTTAAPNRRNPTLPVRGRCSPTAPTTAHPSGLELERSANPNAPLVTTATVTSQEQAPSTSPMLMNAPLPVTQPSDGPESDPPIVRKKGKQAGRVRRSCSQNFSSDPATDNQTGRSRSPRKTTRNIALEDAMDRNSEGAAASIIPRNQVTSQGCQQSNERATLLPGVESNLLQKARPKPKPVTKQPRRQGPTSLVEKSSLPPKARPKPKPIAKQPQRQLPTSAEEQREIEDGLFIRKSTRPRVEKVREAPPAQLRLEKDALKRKGRQNN